VVFALPAAGCNGSAPHASNAPAQVVCAPADAACLSAQAKASEEALERQILAEHQAEVNAAEAAAAAVNGAAGNTAAGADGAPAGGAAAVLADGAYECSDGLHAMGEVDIKGPTFRYLPLGAYSGSFAPYQVDAAGSIQWGGAFAGLNDAPPAVITESKAEPWGFTVTFLANSGAVPQTMICKAPAPKAPHPRSSRPLPSGSVR
jgi:hypothetical protein